MVASIPERDGGTLPSLAAFSQAASQLSVACELLVATAIFDGTQLLRQPLHCKPKDVQARHRKAQRGEGRAAICHVALVDWPSERRLKEELEGDLFKEEDDKGGAAGFFIGCWQLLRVAAGTPYVHGVANALVPKLTLPMLFPSARASLWVDASRQLRAADAAACAAPLHAMGGSQLLAAKGVGGGLGGGDEGGDKGGGGGAFSVDTSIILRRHTPAAAARALATSWWEQWESTATAAGTQKRGHKPMPAETEAERGAAAALSAVSLLEAWRSAVLPMEGLPHVSSEAARWASLPVGHASSDAWPKAPLNARRAFAPMPRRAPTASGTPKVTFARASIHPGPTADGRGGFAAGSDGHGLSSAAERAAALSLSPSAHQNLACGFMSPSAYDHAVRVGSGAKQCDVVTLTAIFDAFDELIQPSGEVLRSASNTELGCFFALVDKRSHELLIHENRERLTTGGEGDPALPEGVRHKIGVWNLILLEGSMPFSSSRRNSRVPKVRLPALSPPSALHAPSRDPSASQPVTTRPPPDASAPSLSSLKALPMGRLQAQAAHARIRNGQALPAERLRRRLRGVPQPATRHHRRGA